MIKELEGELTRELIDKYFWKSEETKEERRKEKELYDMIKRFMKKVYGEEEDIFSYNELFGYLDDYGYYVLIDGDPGRCLPYVVNYGMNKEKAFIKIMIRFLGRVSIQYELENRDRLNKEFNERFSKFNFEALYGLEEHRYFKTLYFTEYEIEMWDKYFDEKIPSEIIKYYEEYLNSIWWSDEQGVMWYYNRATKRFDCRKKEKGKKLERSKDEKRNH